MTTLTITTPPDQFVHLVVGYDGSPPADRAPGAAVRLLQGRTGRIEVVYVAQLSSVAMLSPGAIADELIAVATTLRDAHARATVAIVVGSSSHATHRVIGSVAVSLARHSPVPLVIVP